VLKVYFVDDDDLIIEELKNIIDWNKYDFEICGYSTNPLVASEEIIKYKPTLVICDVQMDVLNGLKLAERITQLNNEIHFCFLSAFDKFDYAIEAIRIGALRYLKKPIISQELTNLLIEIKEKEIKKFSYQLSLILASANPYQNKELCSLFKSSQIFKNNNSFRIVVLFGEVNGIDVGIACSSYITLYSDAIMVINLMYDVNIDALSELRLNKNVSIGVSEECVDYNSMGDLLKRARIASKNKFITGKDDLVIYKNNKNIDLLINKIRKVNYSYELKQVILDLPQDIINLDLSTNYIQSIYQTIIYSLIRLRVIEYDNDLINVSVLHFYQSLNQMTQDLLGYFEEYVEQDYNVTLINEIKDDIKQNLSTKLSLSDYAQKYGYNTSYFSQWFKKVCNKTFVEYVICERIEMAKQLIISRPNVSLRNIAEMVGYDDYYHFSKIFKKYTGFSPIEYQSKNYKN